MAFILTVTLAAAALIALGALGALVLQLRAELMRARDEVAALKARLAAPTVWASLGPEWSEAQALAGDLVARPLAAAALPTPDFTAPQAWLVDPPEPGAPSVTPVQPPPPPLQPRGRGRSERRTLAADGVDGALFPAWTADAALIGVEKPPTPPAPPAALAAALFGVYALATAGGVLVSWPWPALLAVLVCLSAAMAVGFWKAPSGLGLAAAAGMAGLAPFAASLAGAPAALMLPVAGAVCAGAALVSLGRRNAALTWAAAALVPIGVAAAAVLTALGQWTATPQGPAALTLATLAILGLAKAISAPEPALRRPSSALHAGALAALAFGTLMVGPVGAFGAGLAAAALISVALALGPARDVALVSAWLAACVGLYALSGDAAAASVLTPAAALTGAVFLGAALSRAPRPGSHGLVVFALGAAAPIAAAALVAQGPSAALIYAAVAALTAFGFAAVSEAKGSAAEVGAAGWPLALGSAFAGALALSAAAPAAVVGPLAALSAVMAAWLAARSGAAALALVASGLAMFAAVAAVSALSLNPQAWAPAAGAAAAAVLLLAGAWLSGAEGLSRAPASGFVLGTAGLAVCALAPLMALAPAATQLAGLGAVASAWLATAGLLALFAEKDGAARPMRLGFAAAGVCAAGYALVGPANPWWGIAASPLPAGGAASALAVGALAPVALTAAFALISAARREPRASAAGFAAASILGLAGAALALRTAAFGPAGLREPGYTSLELLGLTGVLVAMAALAVGLGDQTARRAGLLLGATALAKFTLLDLHAAGLAPALASAGIGLVLLALAISQREALARFWTGPDEASAATAPKPASP